MKTASRHSKLLFVAALLSFPVDAQQAPAPRAVVGVRGDSAAIVAAERLLAQVGGRALWSRRQLVVEERLFLRNGQVATVRISRDFERRARLLEREGEGGRFVEWVAPDRGWTESGGVRTPMDDATHFAERQGLRQEPYDIYHRLATNDPTLRVQLRTNPARLMVFDGEERPLAWFDLDGRGGLAGWGNYFDGAINHHQYGPLTDFDGPRLPKFGAVIDGRYRFEYTAARLIGDALREPGATSAPAPARVAELGPRGTSWEFESVGMPLRAEVVLAGVEAPSAIAVLPDGRLLVAERSVPRLRLVDPATGAASEVRGLPPMHTGSGGGLLDVVVHPDYARNGWIYYSIAIASGDSAGTAIERARLRDGALVDRARLFTVRPLIVSDDHFAGRLVLQGGFLFATIGDRNQRHFAQDPTSHIGKIIRLHEDGRVPADNPFATSRDTLPEIWAFGTRNAQGLAVHPESGELWSHEHGPRGGDEINLIRRGANYGWPLVSYGREYDGPLLAGGRERIPGAVQDPVHYYVPSIAPSGMLFYTGSAMPAWRGSLLIGAMGLRHLNRVVVRGGRVVLEERLVGERNWRVRSLAQGPRGEIYLGVDGGAVIRIGPRSNVP